MGEAFDRYDPKAQPNYSGGFLPSVADAAAAIVAIAPRYVGTPEPYRAAAMALGWMRFDGHPWWNKVMDELIALDFTLDPTFNIYEANRELMLARRAAQIASPISHTAPSKDRLVLRG